MPISAGPAPRGGHSGAVPPKRGLCLEEINRLGATEVQIEAQNSQIGAYRPRIREQELFFRSCCGLTPDFMKLWGRRPFHFDFHTSLKDSWKIIRILR